jgi:hypothetical protein
MSTRSAEAMAVRCRRLHIAATTRSSSGFWKKGPMSTPRAEIPAVRYC